MDRKPESRKSILITGGTSGLGLELVHLFLDRGFDVITTGRQQVHIHGYSDSFFLYQVDFSDLKQVAITARAICEAHKLSYIINNAGVLSPPEYIKTIDGLEYTFQVNFISHLLINEIILTWMKESGPVRIAAITSPVYRFTGSDPYSQQGKDDYNAMRAYSSSKLYLVLMCGFLSSKYNKQVLQCFSFDPGTFSSGIYRMQKGWFRTMYHIASPFMRKPSVVAKLLEGLMLKDVIVNGMIYSGLKHSRKMPVEDSVKTDAFFRSCYDLIRPYC
jgi:NAD(P)-dependent dehydrogenase (short-subunit alcohol dehydrogenase family)